MNQLNPNDLRSNFDLVVGADMAMVDPVGAIRAAVEATAVAIHLI